MTALYSTSYSVSYTLLKEGSSGNDVKTLQYTLYELGYYKNSVDGKYGAMGYLKGENGKLAALL